jgi:hypothetical protein
MKAQARSSVGYEYSCGCPLLSDFWRLVRRVVGMSTSGVARFSVSPPSGRPSLYFVVCRGWVTAFAHRARFLPLFSGRLVSPAFPWLVLLNGRFSQSL